MATLYIGGSITALIPISEEIGFEAILTELN